MAYSEARFIAHVVALGGTVDVKVYDDGSGAYLVDSPVGVVWAATHTHCLVADFANSGFSWKPKALASLQRDLAEGLTACDDADCDICHPLD